MGRAPCCDKANVKKGPWSPEEDAKLKDYMEKHGTGGNWIALPQRAGLKRCGKSCRLRWLNYLRPNIKHGEFSDDEDRIICTLYANIGSRWSIIAGQLPGRTDNDIKNYWNTKLKKKLMGMNNMTHVQRRLVPPQATTTSFSSLLQASASLPSSPSAPMSSSPSSPYSNSYYNTLVRSLTEPSVSFSSTPLNSNNSNSLITTSSMQESLVSTPMQHYQVNQASCSSSDGSCNNIINSNHAKEEGEQAGNYDQTYNFCSGVEESQQKVMGSNGLWGENLLDYTLEEIKQLISSTSSCNNSINNHSFLFDEIKAEEGILY